MMTCTAEYIRQSAPNNDPVPTTYPANAKTKLTSGMSKAATVMAESIPTVSVFKTPLLRFLIWKSSKTPSRAPTKARGYENTKLTATAIRERPMSPSRVL